MPFIRQTLYRALSKKKIASQNDHLDAAAVMKFIRLLNLLFYVCMVELQKKQLLFHWQTKPQVCIAQLSSSMYLHVN